MRYLNFRQLILVLSSGALSACQLLTQPEDNQSFLGDLVAQATPETLENARRIGDHIQLSQLRQLHQLSTDIHPDILNDLFVSVSYSDSCMEVAQNMVAFQTSDWPDGYRGDFLHAIAPSALVSARKNKIPPSIILAQAILESGWGRSGLSQRYNNLFGIKGFKGTKRVALDTWERLDGVKVDSRAEFRVFDSWEHSIAYHGHLLGVDRRYARARRQVHDWRLFLAALAPKYASSDRYVSTASSIVERYQLDRWDHLILKLPIDDHLMDGEPVAMASDKND